VGGSIGKDKGRPGRTRWGDGVGCILFNGFMVFGEQAKRRDEHTNFQRGKD